MDNCKNEMSAVEKINIKRIEAKILNGRKINIKAILEVETKVYSNNQISIISSIDNLPDVQTLKNEKIINCLLGKGETTVYAKDTIKINETDDLAEIMKLGIKIIDKDIKISYNKILAKADVETNIIYLTEDNTIKSVTEKIPVMGFIDIENIEENNICDVDYHIKNLIIKPNNMDSHSIYVEIEIGIECTAYETKNISLIEDLYSISKNLDFNPKEIITMANKNNTKDILKINESINIPEIENNKLYNIQTTPIIVNEVIKNGKIIFEGELNLEILYESMNGMDYIIKKIPFNFEMLLDSIDNNCSVSSQIDIKRNDFIVNNSNVNISIDLEFNVSSSKNEKLNIIDEINIEETNDNNIYSMVIYFVKPGDTLWKIAKKFKSTVEDIANINNLDDPNKIYIGQQLYIPKFIKNKIAV